MSILKRLWNDESGATAIEYTLIVAAIALVIVVAVDQTGINMNDGVFTDIQDVVL